MPRMFYVSYIIYILLSKAWINALSKEKMAFRMHKQYINNI